jgi:hypothetical protein
MRWSRWRSLQTLLVVGLGSPRLRRELRVWSVKMVPAVPTRIGQMLTSYLKSMAVGSCAGGHVEIWLR